MADSPNTVGTGSLNAIIKDVLHDTVVKTVPEATKLQQMIPLEQKSGRKYLVPVFLSDEQGITRSRPDNGAFTLEDSVPAVSQEAQVEPYQLVQKATMSYEAAFRTEGGGKRAYIDGVRAVMENMVSSLRKQVEIDLLHGQSSTGIGVVNANTTSSTSFVINDATWAPGIWAGAKNSKIAILDAGLATAEDIDESVTSINLNTKAITVGNAQSLDAGDIVYPKNAVVAGGTPTWNQMPGLQKIITNSGTLFNIDASQYELFRGTTVSGVGTLTVAAVLNLVSYAVARGCMEDLVFLCSPKAFEKLNSTLADLRRLDASYRPSKVESGAENIVLHGQNGKLEIIPHLFMKDGEAFVFPVKQMKRLGATDITFKRPNANGGEEMIKESAGVAGFELRAYTSQALFCQKPAWTVAASGITY